MRGRCRVPLVAVAALALAGCPLPQPVPAVSSDVANTPPRILTDTARPSGAVVTVGTACTTSQYVAFGATIDDPDVADTVEARWFVDYTIDAAGVQQNDFPPPSPDGTAQRPLAGFRYFPARHSPAPHVVEVVVSNGFYPIGGDPADSLEPNRTPQPGYETQVYRWYVEYADGAACE